MEQWLLTIAQVFASAGAPLFLVGGAVRNGLLHLHVADYDMCGPTQPEAVFALCQGTGVRPVLRAAHFGTVELHVSDDDGRHMAEYTTFRQDSYRCGHRPEAVRFADTIEVDCLRRDFSVNAMYRPLTPAGLGEVIDPTGGLADLGAGRLHTVTEDPYMVLKDDGIRILRMVRFACDFALTPSPALLKTAAEQAGLLRDIARERLQGELFKILLSDTRYPSLHWGKESPVKKGLDWLSQLQANEILFPRCVISGTNHIACAAWKGIWERLEDPKGDRLLAGRLALLLYGNEKEIAIAALQGLRASTALTRRVEGLVEALEKYPASEAPLWDALCVGSDVMEQLPGLLRAQNRQEAARRAENVWRDIETRAIPLTLREMAIGGEELLPLLTEVGRPAAEMGRLLTTLHREVAEGQLNNEKSALVKRACEWLNGDNYFTF